MKILVFSDIPPHVVGGAETQAARLAEAWQSQGHEVLIVGHRTPSGTSNSLQTAQIKVLYSLGRGMRALSFFASTAKLMLGRGRSYDLIYCRFMGEAALSLTILKALRLLRTPIVSAPGAGGSKGNSDAAFIRSLPASKWLVKLVNRHCNGVNYIAPEIRRSLRELGIRCEWEADIPNGILPSLQRCSGPGTNPNKLLFAGRLVSQKGLDVLLQALAILRSRGVSAQLDIIGQGTEEGALKNLASALGLSESVRFLGLQANGSVQAAMAEAHLFVLPSRYEGLSNAALEALSVGLPGIFTGCGGIDTWVDEQTAWVCSPDDVTSLATTLEAALAITRAEWVDRSQRSQQLVRKHFLLEACANRHIEFFEHILHDPTPRRPALEEDPSI